MEKLKITQQSLGRLTTTSINLDIDTYLKIEKASILTGRRKSEIVAEMVNFALRHTEINGSKLQCDFGINVKREESPKDVKVSEKSPTKTYVSIKEAVAITGLSEYFVRNGVRSGKIPTIKSGNKNLINIESLLEKLQAMEGSYL